jgi:ribonuclease BN (tRNA processing enzyme)
MRLTVLGSGSCELRRERSSPAYLLEAQGFALLLDLGQGALRRLLDSGRDPAGLGAVLLSHHHPDHLGDLVPLLFALNYDPHMRQNARLRLLAHAGVQPLLAGLQGLFGSWLSPPPERLTPTWLEPGQELELGPFRLSVAAAEHTPLSLAFRLELAGASLVYLGDSAASPELARFCQGAGLLIAHCAASDQAPKTGHLSPGLAGRLAAQARVGALLLSHFYAEVDPDQAVPAAKAHFPGPVWAARDLMALTVAPGRCPAPAVEA